MLLRCIGVQLPSVVCPSCGAACGSDSVCRSFDGGNASVVACGIDSVCRCFGVSEAGFSLRFSAADKRISNNAATVK